MQLLMERNVVMLQITILKQNHSECTIYIKATDGPTNRVYNFYIDGSVKSTPTHPKDFQWG